VILRTKLLTGPYFSATITSKSGPVSLTIKISKIQEKYAKYKYLLVGGY
jgi:hypothetical protein